MSESESEEESEEGGEESSELSNDDVTMYHMEEHHLHPIKTAELEDLNNAKNYELKPTFDKNFMLMEQLSLICDSPGFKNVMSDVKKWEGFAKKAEWPAVVGIDLVRSQMGDLRIPAVEYINYEHALKKKLMGGLQGEHAGDGEPEPDDGRFYDPVYTEGKTEITGWKEKKVFVSHANGRTD